MSNEVFVIILVVLISFLIILICENNKEIRGRIVFHITSHRLKNLDGDSLLRHLSFDKSQHYECRSGLTLLSEIMDRFDKEGN